MPKGYIKAADYLRGRKLAHPEAVDYFKIGVCNRTLGYYLPEGNRSNGARIRDELKQVGLLKSNGHEHFRGCITVRIMDENGIITEIYGRRTSNPKTLPKHLYLPGPHKGIFNAASLKTSPEVIICEAIIDALTFWCHGYRYVTASYGTGGFTADHLAVLKEVERVYIAYDNDDAGNIAITFF